MRERQHSDVQNSPVKRSRVALDTRLYDASLLRDEVAFEIAIGDLESTLAQTPSAECIVEQLASVPHLLECMISAVDDNAARNLSECIIGAFPVEATGFAMSLGARILDRFSLFLEFLPYPSPSEKPPNILEKRHYVEHATRALQLLAEHEFATTNAAAIKSGRKGARQKGKKSVDNAIYKNAIDPKVFDALGIPVPTDKDGASAVVKTIIDEQKRCTEYYLRVLRHTHLRDIIRNAYISGDDLNSSTPLPGISNGGTHQHAVSAKQSPAAHPYVQPMKASLYFDSADGFGEWRIWISTAADTDLRRMRKRSSELFKITLKKIRELSNGHFSADNMKQLTQNAAVPIYEAKMTGDSRLVYQIDCKVDFETNVDRQVIKIFGIYTHNQLSRQLWETIGNQLGRQGAEYQARCAFRNRPTQLGKHAGTILPASWPEQENQEVSPSSFVLPGTKNEDLEKAHDMLDLEKYVAFSQALLNSILANQDVMHVFSVSSREKEIIEYPLSCYVLGRSGTGKTTTMMFKMLGIERSWQTYGGGELVKPRQMFVTQSRVLAEKVQEYFEKLHESLLVADRSPEELKLLVSSKKVRQGPLLVDLDEEADFTGHLPLRYGDLADEHFPLFVTYDQLCRLLEADLSETRSNFKSREPAPDINSAGAVLDVTSNDYMQQRRRSFVSYGVFLEAYWAHFPQQWTKGLDPALVFSEIIGIIKGSEKSLGRGCLDRDTYLNLSYRTQSTFADQRDVIYDLFLKYMEQKRCRREYDAADRTHRILDSVRSSGVPGKRLDFLYVDEAQDNLLIDTLLLRSLSKNASTGLFWAGDTAQTISRGSAFRFDDLKAFLYRVELDNSPQRESMSSPVTFQLTTNYRSHAGIVNCAHSIIELITTFWPHAIDQLVPESGIVEGKKPLFLSQWNEYSMKYDQSLFGNSDAGHFEFGARQCILVRDDAARTRLRSRVGNVGTILTLYESKGLEFDDVLLYSFFEDSTVKVSQWRAVFSALPSPVEKGPSRKTLPICNTLPSGVCQDLKFLYVAITRARKNLWISDNSEKCEPMRDFWIANGFVEGWSASSRTELPRLATASAPQEWAEAASMLFKSKRWQQAMESYERAGLLRERDVAEAYSLRGQARLISADSRSGDQARKSAFVKAAKAFWKSGEHAGAERLSYFRVAAECYTQAEEYREGARAYFLAQDFTMAAATYRKAGLFDEAIAVINGHAGSMDPGVVRAVTDVARLEYLRKHNIKRAIPLFTSHDEALEYMDERGLDNARAEFLEQLGRFSEAAQIYLDEGQTIKAIPLLLKDNGNLDATERASVSLLEGLRRRLSFGTSPSSQVARSDVVLTDLCHMLKSEDLEMTRLGDSVRDELCMFREIVSDNGDVSELFKISAVFHQRGKDNLPTALRCLDHGFMCMPDSRIPAADLPLLAETLHHFSTYTELLRLFAFTPNLCDDKGTRDLFAIQEANKDFFIVPKDTFLYGRCARLKTRPGVHLGDQEVLVLRDELSRQLGGALRERLLERVRGFDLLCRKSPAFEVCLQFSVSGYCRRARCPQAHIDVKDHSEESYNLRVRILLQLVLISNSVRDVEHRCKQEERRTFWLCRLHEALNPPFYRVGTLHSLRPDSIPEYGAALQVLRNWTLDWLYALKSHDESGRLIPNFLTALLRIISFGLVFAPGALQSHLPQIELVAAHGPASLLRRTDKTEVHVLLDLERYIRNEHHASLESGILFVNHIIVKQLPVDIAALCELMDNLCGSLIVASSIDRAATLHDITMPRSWLLRLLPTLHALAGKSTNLFEWYVEPMEVLLERIYTSVRAGHLFLETRECNLSTLGFPIRNIFIARICRNLCLLGYNSRFRWLRTKIHAAITSLRQPNREFHHTYRHYVEARGWPALAREVRDRSTSDSPFDEMVQLYDAARGPPTVTSRRSVRRIVYRDVSELAALLCASASTIPRGPVGGIGRDGDTPQQTSTLEQTGAALTAYESSRHAEANEARIEDEDADAAPPAVNLDDEALAFEEPDAAMAQLAEDKVRAAHTFTKFYRARLTRKASAAKTKPTIAIHLRFVHTYRATYTSNDCMDSKHRQYRLLLLIPLPYGMAFLEHVHSYLHETKNGLKKRLKTVRHLELEEVNSKITECNDQLKKATRLIKALEPSAAMHEKREIEALRACMRDVEQLAGCLPTNVTADWEFYLKTAARGILQPEPKPKKPKPKLNMADDERVDYAGGAIVDDD